VRSFLHWAPAACAATPARYNFLPMSTGMMARHTAASGGQGLGGEDMVVEMQMCGRSRDGWINYIGAISEDRISMDSQHSRTKKNTNTTNLFLTCNHRGLTFLGKSEKNGDKKRGGGVNL